MCKRFIRTRPKLASRWHDIRTIQDQLHMSNLPESFEKKNDKEIFLPRILRETCWRLLVKSLKCESS